MNSSPTVANGVVYVGSQDHKVYALNAATGAKLWSYRHRKCCAVLARGGQRHGLRRLRRPTCSMRWTPRPASSCGSLSSAAVWSPRPRWSTVWSTWALDDTTVYAVNAATGAPRWSYTTGGHVTSSPAVANGVVYVGSQDKNIYALNAVTGSKLWSYPTEGDGEVLARSSQRCGLRRVSRWQRLCATRRDRGEAVELHQIRRLCGIPRPRW